MHEHMSTDAFCLWAGRGSSIGQIKEKSHFKSNDFFSLMVSEGKDFFIWLYCMFCTKLLLKA